MHVSPKYRTLTRFCHIRRLSGPFELRVVLVPGRNGQDIRLLSKFFYPSSKLQVMPNYTAKSCQWRVRKGPEARQCTVLCAYFMFTARLTRAFEARSGSPVEGI